MATEKSKEKLSYDGFHDRATAFFNRELEGYEPYVYTRDALMEAESEVELNKTNMSTTITTDWIDFIESRMPALDACVRVPGRAIEDVDEEEEWTP